MQKPGIAVAVVLEKNNKFLFGRRHPNIIGGNYWCIPMGRLEWGEKLVDCAIREVKEETGIEICEIKPLVMATVILETSHYLTVGFLATKWLNTPQITAPEEIQEWCWFGIDELPSPIFQPSKEIIEAYIQSNSLPANLLVEIKEKES